MTFTTLTDEIVFHLKIISKLSSAENQGSKLYVGSGVPCICKPGWFPRRWSGESRTKTLLYLEKTYSSCFQLIDMHVHSTFLEAMVEPGEISTYQRSKATEAVSVLNSIVREMESSISGLDALLSEYSDDSTFVSKVEIIKNKAQRLILNTVTSVENSTAYLKILGRVVYQSPELPHRISELKCNSDKARE
jgi:hypothetical protein